MPYYKTHISPMAIAGLPERLKTAKTSEARDKSPCIFIDVMGGLCKLNQQ